MPHTTLFLKPIKNFSMAKARTQFVCQSCGATAPKWAGQCADCGEWNSMVEGVVEKTARVVSSAPGSGVRRLSEVKAEDAPRIATGNEEMDRVLGGGLVPGSVILIGGDPGIGKSTLLLQAAVALTQTLDPVVYVAGEESPRQVKLRSDRLGLGAGQMLVLPETNIERVLAVLE